MMGLPRGSPDPPPALPSPINIISNPISIATWNILTLNEPSHPQLLASELTRLKVVIAGLQEVRWTQDGETTVGDYIRRRLRLLSHMARSDDGIPAKQVLSASARPPPRSEVTPAVLDDPGCSSKTSGRPHCPGPGPSHHQMVGHNRQLSGQARISSSSSEVMLNQ